MGTLDPRTNLKIYNIRYSARKWGSNQKQTPRMGVCESPRKLLRTAKLKTTWSPRKSTNGCNLGYRVSMTPYRQCMIKQLREKGQIPLRRLMAHPLGSESNSPLLMCGLASLNDFIPECSVKRATVENSDKHQFRQMIFDKSCGVVKMTSDLCSLTYHTHQPSFILRKPSDNPIKSHPRTGEVAQ